MTETETPSKVHYTLGGLSSFIPLQDETAATVSTRGHRLPSIIQSRSSRSLFTLHNRQRRGSDPHEYDEEHGGLDGSATLRRRTTRETLGDVAEIDARRMSLGPEILMTPHMRSMRLIGNSNPRYRWQQYYKTEDQLGGMKKKLREYYERTNFLISQYLYIDKLLDSSLLHNLIEEYSNPITPLHPITEEPDASGETTPVPSREASSTNIPQTTKLKRTPKNLYKIHDEQSPLLADESISPNQIDDDEVFPDVPFEEHDDVDSSSSVVTVAIYLNLAANVVLLAAKIAVIILTSSLSVLASLVDAALDFLSTAIVWTTTMLIQRQDQYAYPIGRRRLEPVGVLVFSVIMITSFFQVALECFNRLMSDDREVVHLTVPAIAIMASTVVIKGFCYFWCRFINNSSVQALAQDAATDVVFNTFSIIFPLIGAYAQIWWLDALGGLLLSFYVIFNWSKSASEHIRNLSGAAATADERNVLLYLTMRFAKTIRYIQGLQAYHAGDKLNVEVDIVLEEDMSLKDSHDLSESLQYVLESVPTVDRAFVHADYKRENLPSHMNQQEQ